MKKLLFNFWLLLLCMIVGGASSVWGTEITYTFTTASWTATSGGSSANWTSGKAGAGFSNSGIQVTNNSSYTGANGTSPTSFSNISSIVLTYNTNKSSGSGTAVVKIGTNEETSQSWGYSGSSDGRTANFTLTYSYATPQTGNVKITLNTTTNSIYLVSCKITYSSSFSVTYAANGGTGTMTDSDSPYEAGDEVTLLSNTFTAPSGKQWSSWAVTDASSNAVTVTDGKFTMPSSNVTVTAQWADLPASNYITVSPTTINVDADGDIPEFSITTDQTLDADPTQFYTTADADETASKPVWITEAAYSDGTLLVSVDKNTGAARTAYFRVEKGSVKSDVITITQDAKTYEIDQYTAPATAHGTITFSPESPVDAGAEVTLTATPASGYSFTADSWAFYKESAGDFVVDESISVTDNKFTMPAYDIYVDGTFTAIAVTGVTLNKTSASLGIGDKETLTATVAPSNALNKAVTWTSSNTSVATVSNGMVTAVAAGSATITVTTTDGSFTATCTVTVVSAVTFDATSDTGTSPLSKNGVSFACNNGALNNGSEYRLYKNSVTTFSVESGKITKIEFTGVSGNPASGFASQEGWTTDGNNGTWAGSASDVSFTASGAQVRATKIKVYVATTATPTFSVAEGTYDAAQSVTISCATDGASIYYTTDGTDPDKDSDEYTSAISITETTTLKAIAIKDGVESDVASATYTMNRPDAPSFDVATCVFDKAFDLHLSTETDGATIYYTTDGSTPSTSSSEYSTKVAISTATTTVKAIAVKDGLTSDVASETYTYDSRTTPTFTLSTTSLDLKVNETSSAVTLTTNSDATPSFTCADAHVTLTGTGKSRTISANAAGTYTVNVSVSGSATYKDAAGTITVTVTKKATTMVLTPSFTSKDLYVTKSGSLTGAPQYNSSDIAGAVVTYSSSDTKVATIASNGAITFKKAGSTTITVSYEGDDEYEECEDTYELTLVDTTPQETEVDITLNNTFFGCDAFTSYAKDAPTSYEGETDNITVTYAKGTGSGFYCNGSGIRLYSGGSLTFQAPTGYTITKIVLEGDSDFEDGLTNPEASTTWEGNSSSVNITGESKSGSTRKNITGATVTIAPTVTITAADYATYCSPHDLDFSETGITVYKAKVDSEKKVVKLTAISDGIVPAGTGVILYKDVDAAATIAVPVTETDATITDNDLVGTTARVLVKKTEDGINYNYILQSGPVFNIAKVEGAYMPANRAYLSTTVNVSASGARLSVVFDDDQTTSISEECRVKSEKFATAIYDLQGRRVENPKKAGLYIKNGKKVIMK